MAKRPSYCLPHVPIPPVPPNQHPSPGPLNPMRRNPYRIGTRRTHPVAASPDVSSSNPAVIAANPHIAAMRRWSIPLHNRRRWSHAHKYARPRHGGLRQHEKSEQDCKDRFLHLGSIPPLSESPESCLRSGCCRFQRGLRGIVARAPQSKLLRTQSVVVNQFSKLKRRMYVNPPHRRARRKNPSGKARRFPKPAVRLILARARV